VRGGRNPARRNRNIGTAAQGHGNDGELTIPGPAHFWERLRNPVWVARTIGDRQLTIAIEPPRAGWSYSVTPDDIATVLRLIPPADRCDLGLVALRQPTEKQTIIEPVWGRLRYFAEIGRYSGPCVILEAIRPNDRHTWRRSGPLELAEIERLRQDGHEVTQTRRGVTIESDRFSVRATQLYRTLPHEIGHYVDYLEKVETGSDSGWKSRWDRYWSRPVDEHEAFAHRYADEFRRRHAGAGSLPFPQVIDLEGVRADGLDPVWFGWDNARPGGPD